jgi:hypothetical protein
MRISNSFSEGEIAILDFILTTLLRGGSAQMATRNKDFAPLCRKVVAMKQKAEAKRREDILKGRDHSAGSEHQTLLRGERSSVGEIEAVISAEEPLEDVG